MLLTSRHIRLVLALIPLARDLAPARSSPLFDRFSDVRPVKEGVTLDVKHYNWTHFILRHTIFLHIFLYLRKLLPSLVPVFVAIILPSATPPLDLNLFQLMSRLDKESLEVRAVLSAVIPTQLGKTVTIYIKNRGGVI